MKTPSFWNMPDEALWRRLTLSPFSYIYQKISEKRQREIQGYKSTIPVICVGNLTMGGTGKTPTVIALAQYFQSKRHAPAILTRGYGGKLIGPILVDDNMDASEVGDEALVMMNFAPVILSHDRAEGAKHAEAMNVDLILMDDGFQNPSLKKDYSLLVIDGEVGFGNQQIFPRGPLRENVGSGLARADLALVIGNERADLSIMGTFPKLHGRLAPLNMGMSWQNRRLYAFAGIGRPEKFFNTLRSLGANLIETRAFGDHEVLSPRLIERMLSEAKAQRAQLITTEKDAVRLPRQYQGQILSLPVRFELEENNGFDRIYDAVFPET